MITAHFDYRDMTLTCDVVGHAGGTKGKDLVCAGASMLVMTLAQKLTELGESGIGMPDSQKTEIADGAAHLSIKAADDLEFALIRLIYNTIASGFLLLSHNYPDKVRVGISV